MRRERAPTLIARPRARARVHGRAPLERGTRRPLPDRHERRRRGPQLQARGGTGRDPGRANWAEMVPHRDDVRLDAVDAFAEHLVLTRTHRRSRPPPRPGLRERRRGTTSRSPIPCTACGSGRTRSTRRTTLRYGYTSLVAPVTDVDYDTETRVATVVKTQPVLGGYDASHYTSARLWATAADGTRVPDLGRASARRAARRFGAGIAVRLRLLRALDSTPRFARRACRSSIAASCTRSRTCAAAVSSGVTGTKAADSSTRRTPSPTSSRARSTSSRRATRRRRDSWRAAAARAGC